MDQPTHTHDQPSGTTPTRAPGSQPTWTDSFSQLDTYADDLRVKLPAAPPGLLNFYMSVVPWLAIIFGILLILISLVALVGSTILGPLAIMFGSPGVGLGLVIGSIIALASSVLEVIGGWLILPRKSPRGWLPAPCLALRAST